MTNLQRIARKITWVLFITQSLASAGFIATAAINPILGAKLVENRSLATLPVAVYLLSGAFSASAWGYIMDRIGRRNAIVSGLVLGILGNVLVLIAIEQASFTLVLIGLMLMGMTNSAILLGRFAAAEVKGSHIGCGVGRSDRYDSFACVGSASGRSCCEHWHG